MSHSGRVQDVPMHRGTPDPQPPLPHKMLWGKHSVMSLLLFSDGFPGPPMCSAGLQTGQRAGDVSCLVKAGSVQHLAGDRVDSSHRKPPLPVMISPGSAYSRLG